MKNLKKILTFLLFVVLGSNAFAASYYYYYIDYTTGDLRWKYIVDGVIKSQGYLIYLDKLSTYSSSYLLEVYEKYPNYFYASNSFLYEVDTDNDGISDFLEIFYNNNLDSDLINVESLYNSDLDSDGDGLRDYYEMKAGTDAFEVSTSYASLMESYNNGTVDSDGTAIDDLTYLLWTASTANETGYLDTNGMDKSLIIYDLSSSDFDYDGISDYSEYAMGLNPFTTTTVADEYYETNTGLDGTTTTSLKDSDGDGYSDYEENFYGTDANSSSSTPGYGDSSDGGSSGGDSSGGSSGGDSSGGSSGGSSGSSGSSSSSSGSSSGSSSDDVDYGDTSDVDSSVDWDSSIGGYWTDTDDDGIPDTFVEDDADFTEYSTRFDTFKDFLIEKLGLEDFETIFTDDVNFNYPVYTLDIPIYGDETLSFEIDLEELSEYSFVQIFRSILFLLFLISLFYGLIRFWRDW